MVRKEHVELIFALENLWQTKPDVVPTGGWVNELLPQFTGTAYISDLQLNAPDGSPASYTCTFQGCGQLAHIGGDVPPTNISQTIEFVDYACQVTGKEILQSNYTVENISNSKTGQDGRLYFGTNNNGIWFLDDDDLIKQTNVTTDIYYCTGMGQDGRLYFGGNSANGIWFLDDDGLIKQTSKTDGSFQCAGMGQDGKLYFGSYNNTGIWFLDDDEEIKQTNQTTGSFYHTGIDQNGRLYFGGYYSGIWFLDDDGEIKQTNQTTGNFYDGETGQDGKLYFGTITSQFSNITGIWYLDWDGLIKQTNVTTDSFESGGMGQDGKLYFCGNSDNGIWFLDDDGEIKQTNHTKGYLNSTGMGQNGKRYFEGYYLQLIYSNLSFARTAIYRRLVNGVVKYEQTFSMLDIMVPFDLTPEQYVELSEADVEDRESAMIATIGRLLGQGEEIEVLNGAIGSCSQS
jgi:tetrahydromethanopterin S-methyltransferase subunit F